MFSRLDGRWLDVDPIRSIVNKCKVSDPTSSSINTPPNAAVAQLSRFNSPIPNKKPSEIQQNAEQVVVCIGF
jgi:xeroderma pigmentosum group C-complementing protein